MRIIKKTKKDDAVSPVVGVMLMIVVTVLIAAIVAAMATGIFGDTQVASTVNIKLDSYDMGTVNQSNSTAPYDFRPGWNDFGSSVYGGSNSNYAPYNMTLMHNGGDSLSIKDLTLAVTYNGATYQSPVSDLTNVTKFSVGDKLLLSVFREDGKTFIDHTTKYYQYGISQQSMLKKAAPTFSWSIIDASGYVIAKGEADALNEEYAE